MPPCPIKDCSGRIRLSYYVADVMVRDVGSGKAVPGIEDVVPSPLNDRLNRSTSASSLSVVISTATRSRTRSRRDALIRCSAKKNAGWGRTQ